MTLTASEYTSIGVNPKYRNQMIAAIQRPSGEWALAVDASVSISGINVNLDPEYISPAIPGDGVFIGENTSANKAGLVDLGGGNYALAVGSTKIIPDTIFDGTTTVVVSTATPLSAQVLKDGITIQCHCAVGRSIRVGGAAVGATTGVVLTDGESYPISVDNADQVYIFGTNILDTITWTGS